MAKFLMSQERQMWPGLVRLLISALDIRSRASNYFQVLWSSPPEADNCASSIELGSNCDYERDQEFWLEESDKMMSSLEIEKGGMYTVQ